MAAAGAPTAVEAGDHSLPALLAVVRGVTAVASTQTTARDDLIDEKRATGNDSWY